MKKYLGSFYLVLVMFIFAGGFSGCSDEKASKDINALKSSIEKIEGRVANLENSVKRAGALEAELQEIRQSMEGFERDIMARLASVSEKIAESQTKKVEVQGKNVQKYYVVKRGDSLFGIARKHKMTTDQLCKLNNITIKTVLHPGVKLLVN